MKMKILVFISVFLSLAIFFLALQYFNARNKCGGCLKGCRTVCAEPVTACSFYSYSGWAVKGYLNSCNINYLDQWLQAK